MDWYQAVVLGAVQGLTEFLPISSSGHLILFPAFFGWELQSLAFDVVLHLGTALALIIYFWKDLVQIVLALTKDLKLHKTKIGQFSEHGRLGVYILIGSLPAVVLGLFAGDFIEETFRGVLSVVVFSLFGTVLMIGAEVVYKRRQQARTPAAEGSTTDVRTTEVNGKKALTIGIFQSLALFSGVSRSGATISGGMVLGLTRERAARFSFLLSIPIVLAAGAFKVVDAFSTDLALLEPTTLFFGFLSSFLVGWAAIAILLKYLKTHTLWVFIVYRLILLVVIVLLIFGAKTT